MQRNDGDARKTNAIEYIIRWQSNQATNAQLRVARDCAMHFCFDFFFSHATHLNVFSQRMQERIHCPNEAAQTILNHTPTKIARHMRIRFFFLVSRHEL